MIKVNSVIFIPELQREIVVVVADGYVVKTQEAGCPWRETFSYDEVREYLDSGFWVLR